MAAGMGSRFGGLKQIIEADSFGHILIDYSVYDAILAGFKRVVFIIKKENEEDFRRILSMRHNQWGRKVDIVYQALWDIPTGFNVPIGRSRPWGTAHAISCLCGKLDSPFAVINADDFYGRGAFCEIYNFLSSDNLDSAELAMIGYRLGNTLSKNGGVCRGVCRVEDGYLADIREVCGIVGDGGKIHATSAEKVILDPSSVVSMNLWGLKTYVIDECRVRLSKFLEDGLKSNPLGCEFYLPTVISELVECGRARVRVIDCGEVWRGITYREDRIELRDFLDGMIEQGIYPENM